ncbi:sensor histidine kinase [Oceanirhabdus sp. W0125-5]|uniref:sensor histidine kinase n=1 Tax=Oceanirhabdus sp. W0125-5 TaxID=2999116 RepID=UPI0022F2D531|nr:sensor histidine kinase [Oceanirhabdus sp. W0125-5]WBW96872.1 sensor histidine kinase [Oceanirhabdus sp. W0125-5]
METSSKYTKRKLLSNIISDMKWISIFYILNFISLYSFFKITTGSTVELVYPLLISLFFYLLIFIMRYFQHLKVISYIFSNFNQGFIRTINDSSLSLLIRDEINRIRNLSLKDINTLKKTQQDHNKLVSSWAHNMKTPLTVINLTLQKLSKQYQGHDATTLIPTLKDETWKLEHSLQSLIHMFKLQDFSLDFIPEDVDLNESVLKVISSFKHSFLLSGVKPIINMNGTSPNVITDKKWNEFIISQLISNAVKYTSLSSGEKKVIIDITNHEKGLLLIIKDTGIGIPPEDIPRIYDAYFTGTNGRRIPSSTGIGLFMVKKICDKLDFKITLDSELKKGTQISILYKRRSKYGDTNSQRTE